VSEQRYKAVLAVIADGPTVSPVASEWGVQTTHRWLARFVAYRFEGLGNRSYRPAHCPHQTPPEVEARLRARDFIHVAGRCSNWGVPLAAV